METSCMYQRVQCSRTFPKPKLFDNMEDAEEERAKWNTGVIVNYETGRCVQR